MHISAIELIKHNTDLGADAVNGFCLSVSSEFSPRMVFILIIGVFSRSHFWIRLFSAPGPLRVIVYMVVCSLFREFLHFFLRQCDASSICSFYFESAAVNVMSINTELLLQSPKSLKFPTH